MSNVRILPEILSNKIAAGEVVERPGSVVKELVENSLDAKSTMITVDVDNGGKSMIRVSDNGIGMARDDALLCVERYATSKIYEDKDLFSISTLGFRGEALPSIASVSRFTLITRDVSSDAGTMIYIEGGKIKKVSETGAPVGTMIKVEHLFFNTPARRKFLKTTNTETAHIMDTMSSIALGWPNVQFRFNHNGKTVKSWPQAEGYYDRAVDIMGKELHTHLHDVIFDDSYLSIEGFVSSPDITRGNAQRIFIYINGRYIRDRSLVHAITEAYGYRLMKGRFPVAVLFLNIPCDQLDVNVHPTKHEVRYVDHNRVYTSVKTAVAHVLSQTEVSRTRSRTQATEIKPEIIYKAPEPRNLFHTYNTPQAKADEVCDKPVVSYSVPFRENKSDESVTSLPAHQEDRFRNESEYTLPYDHHTAIHRHEPQQFFSSLSVIGQLKNSYILCDSVEGLIIIDQHAAHERIVFEELKKRTKNVQSQTLLIPETIELGYREAEALETVIPGLIEMGLEIEPFGGRCFAVKSVPAILSTDSISKLIIEIAEKLVEIGSSQALEKALDECLILMSCHGAIRANQSLSEKQIHYLLKQLDSCESPSFCPHGRPTWTRYSMKSIEKAFKR